MGKKPGFVEDVTAPLNGAVEDNPLSRAHAAVFVYKPDKYRLPDKSELHVAHFFGYTDGDFGAGVVFKVHTSDRITVPLDFSEDVGKQIKRQANNPDFKQHYKEYAAIIRRVYKIAQKHFSEHLAALN